MDIVDLLRADSERMRVLEIVAKLELPDCWLAAGFIRNMVWDALHGYKSTPLNDIDVIFYDPHDTKGEKARAVEQALKAEHPGHNWEVRNQALMHLRNGDAPYSDSAEAMCHWPEKETAIGVRLDHNGAVEVLAPFGTDSLLAGRLTYNPKRSYDVFLIRVRRKQWLQRWPKLTIVQSASDAQRQGQMAVQVFVLVLCLGIVVGFVRGYSPRWSGDAPLVSLLFDGIPLVTFVCVLLYTWANARLDRYDRKKLGLLLIILAIPVGFVLSDVLTWVLNPDGKPLRVGV